MQIHLAGSAAAQAERIDLQARLRLLAACPIFAALPTDVLEGLALAMTERLVARGTAIFAQGDAASALFGIMAGQVRITVGGEDGRRHVLRTLGPGEMFGEIAVLDGQRRSADAVAATKCRVILLERSQILKLIEAQPGVAIRLMAVLCAKLRATSAQMEGLLFGNLASRLACILLDLTGERSSGAINITQTELGELTGVTRESVNKKLRAWQAAGLVALQPGQVALLDRARLRAMVSRTTIR